MERHQPSDADEEMEGTHDDKEREHLTREDWTVAASSTYRQYSGKLRRRARTIQIRVGEVENDRGAQESTNVGKHQMGTMPYGSMETEFTC